MTLAKISLYCILKIFLLKLGSALQNLGGVYMDSDISASRCNSAKRYIVFLHFLVRYHLPVYMKETIYRLTNQSFEKAIYRVADILCRRAIFYFLSYKRSRQDNYPCRCNLLACAHACQ